MLSHARFGRPLVTSLHRCRCPLYPVIIRHAATNAKKREPDLTFDLNEPVIGSATPLPPLPSPSAKATRGKAKVKTEGVNDGISVETAKPKRKKSSADGLPQDDPPVKEKPKRGNSRKKKLVAEDQAADGSSSATTPGKVLLSDLPATKNEAEGIDGPSVPLPPLDDPRSGFEQSIEAQLEIALNEHRIPDSPLAKTIFRNWKRFPDCIVLTRVGKFYESYYEAATHLSSILDIKLTHKTQRAKVIDGKKSAQFYQFPFAGFPVASLDKYLKILVQDQGRTVVLVDEHAGEDSEGLRQRKVGQVVTPGTLLDASWINGVDSRYLLSIAVSEQPAPASSSSRGSLRLWLAYTDVSTGEFFSKETTLAKLEDELTRISPREIVLDAEYKDAYAAEERPTRDDHTTVAELLSLVRIFGTHVSFAHTYTPPEIEGIPSVPISENNRPLSLEAQSISLLRHHLMFALRENAPDLSRPDRQSDSASMHIDAATLIGLEIRQAIRYGEGPQVSPISAKGTLLSVLDKTVTPAGHRFLVRTISAPLRSIDKIEHRQALVQAFLDREDLRTEVQDILKPLRDLPRLIQRLRQGRGSIDDLWEVGVWIRGVTRACQLITHDVELGRQRLAESYQELDDDFDQERESLDRLEAWVASLNDVGDVCESIEKTVRGDIVRALQSAGRKTTTNATEESDDDPEVVVEEDNGESDLDDAILDDDSLYPEGMRKAQKDFIKRCRKADTTIAQQWWINPSANARLTRLHNELSALDRRRDSMQADLQKRFLTDPKQVILLFIHEKLGPTVIVSKATDRADMIQQPGFSKYHQTTWEKFLDYKPWTELGTLRLRKIEEVEKEQQVVYSQLRNQVNQVSEQILENAKIVDELDLCMSFAETADDWGWARPKMTLDTSFKVKDASHPVVEAALLTSTRAFVRNTVEMTPEKHLHIITGPNQGGKSTLLRQIAIIAILAQSGSFVPAEEAEIGIVDQLFSRIGARDDLFRDRSTFMLEMVETAAILRDATRRSLVIMDEIGRGTTLQAGMAIAYATLDYILGNVGCRTLFATHYHELEDMLRVETEDGIERPRDGIEYWCTDVDEADDGAVSYSYHLKPGINYNSHAILAARMAGMPPDFMRVAGEKLAMLQHEKSEDARRRRESGGRQ